MNVAWALLWGGSRSAKPCVFPCKVAAVGDETYLLFAAVAAAVGLPFFLPHCNGGFKLLWVCLCVRSQRVFWNLWLQWNGYMIVTTFCCHVCVETCGFATKLVPPLCSATSGCSCVRSFMRFLNLWLQIALEWLHDCCHALLPCA